MNTTATGRAAEQLAADYLSGHGYQIVDRNWRNRWCELDLVARGGDTIHIIEVKYRRDPAFGAASEYVGRAKVQRLRRAAVAWSQAHGYDGPFQLDVIAVEGPLVSARLEHLPNCL